MSKLFGPTLYTEHDLTNEAFQHLGKNVRIARSCTIFGAENISSGSNLRIDGYCTVIATGQGYLNLGPNIHTSGYCAILAADGVSIADISPLSWGVKVFTRSDYYSSSSLTNPTAPSKYTGVSGGAITLSKLVTVGADTTILPKVPLGERAAIGALAMVSKDLAPWGIYSGVPAIRINDRKRDLAELEQHLRRNLAANDC